MVGHAFSPFTTCQAFLFNLRALWEDYIFIYLIVAGINVPVDVEFISSTSFYYEILI